jgi:RimJ/RimL family protein N-acetyltransferase
MDVGLREITVDDEAAVAAYVAVENACLVDAPWWPASTVFRQRMRMIHGDGTESARHFLVEHRGEPVGRLTVHLPLHDNLDQSWIELAVHPDHRRRGHGSAAMDLAFEFAGTEDRIMVGWFGWDGEQTRGFASSRGSEVKSVAVCRRQHLRDLEPGLAPRLFDEARPHATAYELLRVPGRVSEDLLPAFLDATAAINDAPRDGLEVEDEVFSPERNRAFEDALLASDFRIFRVLARHSGTGEVAGVTSMLVDGETPTHAHQLDTSVVGAHRGHRLGVLLKTDMMRWLAETEPDLQTVDTFNAESNDHMVAVNDRLGYRVMGRELQYQDAVA